MKQKTRIFNGEKFYLNHKGINKKLVQKSAKNWRIGGCKARITEYGKKHIGTWNHGFALWVRCEGD